MKSTKNVLLIVLLLGACCVCQSHSLLEEYFPRLSSGVQRLTSSVRDGFSRLVSPLTGFVSSGGNRRLSGGGGRLFDAIPFIGSCDRIAYQGVTTCLSNFRPSALGSKGQCCAWRKYRACINGLRTGVRWAAQTERCPSHSFSRATINGISDRLVGFPLSACGRNPCGGRG